jgi:hypothetical protein
MNVGQFMSGIVAPFLPKKGVQTVVTSPPLTAFNQEQQTQLQNAFKKMQTDAQATAAPVASTPVAPDRTGPLVFPAKAAKKPTTSALVTPLTVEQRLTALEANYATLTDKLTRKLGPLR